MGKNKRVKLSAKPRNKFSDKKVEVKKIKHSDERFTFNFSFLCPDKNYSLNGLSKNNSKIIKKLLNKLEYLSKFDRTTVYNLPRETGLETIPAKEVNFRLNSDFIKTKRDQEASKDFWIFRLSKQGRVLGKINDDIFYILAIDSKFKIYKH